MKTPAAQLIGFLAALLLFGGSFAIPAAAQEAKFEICSNSIDDDEDQEIDERECLTQQQVDYFNKIQEANQQKTQKAGERVLEEQKLDLSTLNCKVSVSIGSIPQMQGGADETPVRDQGVRTLLNGIGSLTKGIADQTGSTKVLSERICAHLNSIRRIEADREHREIVEDPAAVLDAELEYRRARQALINFMNTGQDLDGDGTGDAAQFPANRSDHITQRREEAVAVAVEDLKYSGNLYQQEIRTTAETIGSQTFRSNIRSDVTKAQLDAFNNNPKSLPAHEYWDMVTKLAKPQNNPLGSFLLVQSEIEARKSAAEFNAIAELIEGNGILPNRICVQQTVDGKACRKWHTVQPGTVLRDTYSQAITYFMDKSRGTKTAADRTGSAPGLGGILNPLLDPAKAPVDNSAPQDGDYYDPEDDLDGDGIDNETDSDIDNDGLPNEYDSDYEDYTGVNPRGPTVAMDLTAVQGTDRLALTWTSRDAVRCETENAWITATSVPQVLESTDRKIEIPTSGSAAVKIPLLFDIQIKHMRGGQGTTEVATMANQTTNDGVGQTSVITVSTAGLQAGDSYRLFVKMINPETSQAYTPSMIVGPFAAGATAAQVVTAMKAEVDKWYYDTSNPANAEFRKYEWKFEGDTMTVKTRARYAITCYDAAGEGSTKEVSYPVAQ